MAKGEGFEPSIRDKPYTRLAGERLQPLGHPFIRLLFSSRFELLASPVARNERAFTLPFAFVQVLFFKSCIFFASLTANATFPPLSAISLGLFSGIWGRPISLSLNTGFCRPISLSLNTGSWLRLLPVGQYASAVALYRPLGSIRALSAMFVRKPLTGVYINKRRFNPRRCWVFRRRWGGATRSKPLTGAIISLAMMFQRKE